MNQHKATIEDCEGNVFFESNSPWLFDRGFKPGALLVRAMSYRAPSGFVLRFHRKGARLSEERAVRVAERLFEEARLLALPLAIVVVENKSTMYIVQNPKASWLPFLLTR